MTDSINRAAIALSEAGSAVGLLSPALTLGEDHKDYLNRLKAARESLSAAQSALALAIAIKVNE